MARIVWLMAMAAAGATYPLSHHYATHPPLPTVPVFPKKSRSL